MSSPDDLIIRPVLLQDAEALWTIARQEGVIETTMALPSLRLEQRMKSLSELGENDHCMVAERAGKVAGVAGLTVGTGRVRHSGYIYCPADPRFTTLSRVGILERRQRDRHICYHGRTDHDP